MLALEGVEIRLGDFALAADLTVPSGITAVVGPSGAGKSTLLAAIAGFVAPVAGRVTWQGRDLTPLPPGDRPVSVLFQDNNLFPHLDIARNAGFGIDPNRRLTAEERARVDATLDRVGLGGMGGRRPGDLSGGQQSRAALARVLVSGRPVVLLDEPFSALGPGLKREMLDLTAEVLAEAGATGLIVTHDPADARRVAPRTILVADGIAHPPADTATLFDDPPPALAGYL